MQIYLLWPMGIITVPLYVSDTVVTLLKIFLLLLICVVILVIC